MKKIQKARISMIKTRVSYKQITIPKKVAKKLLKSRKEKIINNNKISEILLSKMPKKDINDNNSISLAPEFKNLHFHLSNFIKEPIITKKNINSKILLDVEYLKYIIENQNDKALNLKEIKIIYQQKYKLSKFSTRTLHRILRKNKIRYRNCNYKNIKIKQEEIVIQEKIFLDKISDLIDKKYELIFIDETHFAQNKLNRKQWQVIDSNSSIFNKGRVQSVNIIGACYKGGLFSYTSSLETNNSKTFVAFLDKMFEDIEANKYLKSKLQSKKLVLILDNCHIHKARETLLYLTNRRIEVLFLPCYYPSFNLIELCWAKIKKEYYKWTFNSV